ncbi:outer membrane protein assembly factor BamB family protein [Acanthopleuribacter pedis]|uniref:PQQ-binding-like beta-propeller repeat protein n=1 Tax=Acanthopleuribacter pedis TaxID=442870 RepID=A0A8J7QFB9_9BACT|nr:PQQ-binding-like beta-propeller repeat protein [Acanthopleuribacter pedis]MBO1317633.1 PQQ-binding-like beta-propeller repeat protein [Acanthopleuribacter pedis]
MKQTMMPRLPARAGLFLALACFCLPLTAGTDQWVHWRGPTQKGTAEAENLPEKWSQKGENLLWHAPYGSRMAPLVMNGHVYIINLAGEGETAQERVMALDLNTGEVVWEYRFNVFLTDIVAHRVGNAVLAGDPTSGYIYAQGVQGLFYCFNKDGKVVWQHSLTEQFGRISGYGGRVHSPFIVDDLVIIGVMNSSWGPHARPNHRFLALDKKTGETLWWSTTSAQPLDTTYSVPFVTNLDGRKVFFTGMADGSAQALDAYTGEMVWNYRFANRGINVSPVYADGIVYIAHSEENIGTPQMGRLLALDARMSGDASDQKPKWDIMGLADGYASPILTDDFLVVADNSANLYALDPKTGKQLWHLNYGTAARGSGVYADGKIYIGEMNGAYHIIQADKNGAKHLHEEVFRQQDGSPIEIFASPAVVQNRVILPTIQDIYCIGNKAKIGEAKAVAEAIPPRKRKASGKAASIRIMPAETWLAPGEKQAFRVAAFDAKGVPMGMVEAELSAKGLPGKLDGKTFVAGETTNTRGGTITAKYGDLTHQARLRVFPKLPYHEDFEDLKAEVPPAGWITSKTKSMVIEQDGGKVLKKLADRPAPPFARMRNYIMPPLPAGYTIQADVKGEAKRKRFVPDMGLINSRYFMVLMGTVRKRVVRLVTWDPMPRLQVDVPFAWEAEKWYTMKMSYDIVDGKGLVRGKVWERGTEEPKDWTIEMTDPVPNEGGSPGLYGYSVAITAKSPGTPVYYDNVVVEMNK